MMSSAVDAALQLDKMRLGDDDRYRMDHARRGRFIIINNRTFQGGQWGERQGTDVDAKNLKDDFEQLGFEVDEHHNQTAFQMLQLMAKASSEDYSDCDCFAVAVLTHGGEDKRIVEEKLKADDGTEMLIHAVYMEEVFIGSDGNSISIKNFVDPIKNPRSHARDTLAGKPKIFIFQACRGDEFDEGMQLEDHDATAEKSAPPQRIPIEADFLYAYSTVPGHYSWRNGKNGSWFIQGLHRMMRKFKDKPLDFLSLLTRVNHEVAYGFESNTTEEFKRHKKQVPSIQSMLTKDIYFTSK